LNLRPSGYEGRRAPVGPHRRPHRSRMARRVSDGLAATPNADYVRSRKQASDVDGRFGTSRTRRWRAPAQSVSPSVLWHGLASERRAQIADSGRAALAEGCFIEIAGLVLRRRTCPRVRARAGRRIAGTICRRAGPAARPVLVRAGHAVGDVDPLRRGAERGEGVTLWGEIPVHRWRRGRIRVEHRHRRGCRLASRHRDCSPNQSYGNRCPGRPRDWLLVKDGVGRGSPCNTPWVPVGGRATMSIAPASSSPPSRGARSTPQWRWLKRSTIDRGPSQLDSGEAGRAMET
jgi:hypothetical protein